MENLTVNKKYEDQTAYVNVAFANRGNQATYSGTGVIATITMKALTDVTLTNEVIDLSKMMLIGPTFDYINGGGTASIKEPQIVTAGDNLYQYGTDFTMKMTNDVLTTDDGENVQKFIQQNSYNGLFDGNKNRDFEFKYSPEQYKTTVKVYPEEISLPLTLHVTPKGEADIHSVTIENANKGNGYVTSVSAEFFYDDGTSATCDTQTLNADAYTDYAAFTFEDPKAAENMTVSRVAVTIEKAINASNKEVTNMLTLSTMTVKGAEDTALTYDTDFTLSMTNEVQTTDDGNNVSAFIQQGNYNVLFTGTQGRNFEFKWDIAQNYVDKEVEYIHVPVTLQAVMAEAKQVDTVTVYNANKGNGFFTKASAVFYYADESSQSCASQTIDHGSAQGYESLTFTNPDSEKAVSKVDLVIEEINGTDQTMLTLSELELGYHSSVTAVERVTPSELNVKEVYKGSLADIDAVLAPENATNPYFKAVSSDGKVVRIVKLAGADGYPVYKAYAVGAGTATITLTALESEDVTASYEIKVKAGADKSELIELITKCHQISNTQKIYTEASYEKLRQAVMAAEAVKEKEDATEKEVKQAVKAMNQAIEALEETPVTKDKITDKSGMSAEAKYSDSNVPSNLLDGDETTRWESPYWGSDAGLPKEIVVSLGGAYDLEKVELVKYSAMNGRLVKYEILVSTDGVTYTSVGVKETEKTELKTGIRMDQRAVTHVKVIVMEALNADGSSGANYAGLTEIHFYGEKQAVKANKEELLNVIGKYEKITNDNYTDDTWKAFTAALTAVKNIYDDENATQEAADAAVVVLDQAYQELTKKKDPEEEPKVDKEALKAVIDSALALKEDEYTQESWSSLKTALTEALAVRDKEDAAESQVAEAKKNLESAVAALKKKADESNPGGSEDNNPSNPGGSEDNNPSDPGADDDQKLPAIDLVEGSAGGGASAPVQEWKKGDGELTFKGTFQKTEIQKVYLNGDINHPLEEGKEKDYVVVDHNGTILSRLLRAAGENGVSVRLTEKYLSTLEKGQEYILNIVTSETTETNPNGVYSAKFAIAKDETQNPDPTPDQTPTPTPDPTPGQPSGNGQTTGGSTGNSNSGSSSGKKTYVILNESGSYNINQGGTYSIRIDADHSRFKSVKLDGNPVDESNYEHWSGSTWIRFSEEFMRTLSLGERRIEVKFTDGTAATTVKIVSYAVPTEIITVQNQTTTATAPGTGDASDAVFWSTLSIACGGAFLFINGKKRKEQENS